VDIADEPGNGDQWRLAMALLADVHAPRAWQIRARQHEICRHSPNSCMFSWFRKEAVEGGSV
jgi:hypothetical protein